eukprot:scaffold183521_cov29-Tisochrysis_lutea.AAC.2
MCHVRSERRRCVKQRKPQLTRMSASASRSTRANGVVGHMMSVCSSEICSCRPGKGWMTASPSMCCQGTLSTVIVKHAASENFAVQRRMATVCSLPCLRWPRCLLAPTFQSLAAHSFMLRLTCSNVERSDDTSEYRMHLTLTWRSWQR